MSIEPTMDAATELRTVITRLVKKLRRQSKAGQQLSLTERSVLVQLQQQGPLHPGVLAAMEKVTNQSMSQILNHLSALNLVRRTPSEEDKRKVLISLTEAGETILTKIRSEPDEWLAEVIHQTCSKEEVFILRQAAGLMTRMVNFE